MRHAQNVRRPSHGSSTGAPGFPTGSQDTRSQYDPVSTGVNPSTGAGYEKPPPIPSRPFNSYDQPGHVAPTQQASTAQRTNLNDRTTAHPDSTGDKYAQKGEDFGRKAQGVMAGVHGAGESLRGALTGAVDRAFGTTEGPRGAEHNEEIARRGEREIQTGQFTHSGR
ncbi:hypothetical protein N7523_004697 [Penicillium sp. IBT 18751x]|nr:hypothetical protein N7523_004697 [Penicillium sp. IBT 18751x]